MSDNHLIPNTTQVPNVILDLLMPFLWDSEARVLTYLCRRTYGFQKETDAISLDQFVHGIRGETRQLDFGAGVSRQAAMNALAVLKGLEIVQQIEGGRGRGNVPVYRLNLKCEIVYWLDLIAQEPDSAREKIVYRIDLIRQKSLPYGPFHKKSSDSKAYTEKVNDVDLLEKGLVGSKKGLPNRPTKPSITKPRKKKIPPVTSKEVTSPERGKRLPEDWQPLPEDLQWAHANGYDTLLDLPTETYEFRNYWHALPGKGARKLDWSKTWQNRIMDQIARKQQHRARASPRLSADPDDNPYRHAFGRVERAEG